MYLHIYDKNVFFVILRIGIVIAIFVANIVMRRKVYSIVI